MKFWVINGPNLNLLGLRKPEVYGMRTLEQINSDITTYAEQKGIELEFFHSNSEGAIIDKLQSALGRADAIILNAGAYTHYSYAIRDAIEAICLPVVEVHMSDINSREPFRRVSVIGDVCADCVVGFGEKSYIYAIDKAQKLLGGTRL